MYRFLVPKGQKKTTSAHQDTAATSSMCGNAYGEIFESSSLAASDGVKNTITRTQKCSNSVPNDLNRANPHQPVLKSYPRTVFGGRERCFSAAWYQSRPWLEYSVERDACFCFPCRVFGVAFSENDTFVSTGFRNWKAALERDRGLQKHVSSQAHLQASAAWTEFCR